MSVSVQYEHLYIILYNPFFIGLCIGIDVGQCEHTMMGVFTPADTDTDKIGLQPICIRVCVSVGQCEQFSIL